GRRQYLRLPVRARQPAPPSRRRSPRRPRPRQCRDRQSPRWPQRRHVPRPDVGAQSRLRRDRRGLLGLTVSVQVRRFTRASAILVTGVGCASMSYDLIFARLRPGQSWDEYLADEERDADLDVSELDACTWARIVDRVRAILPDVHDSGGELDDERTA